HWTCQGGQEMSPLALVPVEDRCHRSTFRKRAPACEAAARAACAGRSPRNRSSGAARRPSVPTQIASILVPVAAPESFSCWHLSCDRSIITSVILAQYYNYCYSPCGIPHRDTVTHLGRRFSISSPRSSTVSTGRITAIRADKGFGFIKDGPDASNSNDIFFHRTAVVGVEFEDLHEG